MLEAAAYLKWLWGGSALRWEVHDSHLYLYLGHPDFCSCSYPNPEERVQKQKKKKKPQRGRIS
jgi:hypothetical protein